MTNFSFMVLAATIVSAMAIGGFKKKSCHLHYTPRQRITQRLELLEQEVCLRWDKNCF